MDLDLIFGQIESLRALGADEQTAVDGDRRYDFSIRWGVLLAGRLQRLISYDSRGELSTGDKRRFDELSAELREVAPLATRLGMADPSVNLARERES